MPVATATKQAATPKGSTNKVNLTAGLSLYSSTQARFTTSKLIQNLGSGNDGVQFMFDGELRTAHGRD